MTTEETAAMFIEGTRIKIRFEYKGICSIEDLWDLSLTALDMIYKNLMMKMKEFAEDSLLGTKNKEGKLIELKINIVKHIFKVKQEEKEAVKKAVKDAAMKKKLLTIKAKRQENELEELSDEDLDKMINEL